MDDGIRVSDADRDRVTAQLRDHFVAGRITTGELDERPSEGLNAKTFGDLGQVMADLPRPVRAPVPAAPPPTMIKSTVSAGSGCSVDETRQGPFR